MEIERKFKLPAFPAHLPEVAHLDQYQGYLAVAPEVRIRRTVNHADQTETYILCIKSIGDLTRHEVETAITREQFEELSAMLDYPLIHKDQRVYRLPDGLLLECSVVDRGAFSYAEVEFDSEEAAAAWSKPDFLGEEMTYNRSFRMRTYWSNRELAKNI